MTHQLLIRDVMSKDILECPPSETIQGVARLMSQKKCSSILIVEHDRPVGIWTEKDALKINFNEPESINSPISEVMSFPVKTISGGLTLEEAAFQLKEERIRHYLVIDENETIIGIITQTDIVYRQEFEHFLHVSKVSSIVTLGLSISSNSSLSEASKLMFKYKLDALAVSSPSGSLGIISESDIVRSLGIHPVPKIIGEISTSEMILVSEGDSIFQARNMMMANGFRHLGVRSDSKQYIGMISFFSILESIRNNFFEVVKESTEKELLQRTAEFAAVFRSMSDCVLVTGTDRKIRTVNPACEKLFGYHSEEMIGQQADILYANKADYLKQGEIRFNPGAKKNLNSYAVRYRRKDGSVFSGETTGNMIKGQNGDLLGFLASIRDVSARKQADEALKKSEFLLGETGRIAKIGGWELEAESLAVSWTKETYRIHELPLGEKPPLKDAIHYYHPDDRPKLEAAVKKALEQGEPYDLKLRFITAKGKHLWVRTNCKPITENHRTLKLMGTIQDITDTVKSEEERREKEERVRVIYEQSNDAILLLDLEQDKIIDFNKKAVRLLEYSPEELRHIPVSSIHSHEIEKFTRFAQSLVNSEKGSTEELSCLTKSGKCIPVEVSASSVKALEGNYVLALVRDISERKKQEGEVRQYQHIVSSVTDMVALLDRHYVYLAVNSAYAKAFAKKENEVVGLTISNLFGESFFKAKIKMDVDRCLAGEEVRFSRWTKFPVGKLKYMDVFLFPYRGTNKEVLGLVVTARDNTALKKAEEQIHTLSQAVEQSPVSVVITGTDANIEYVNKAFEALTGYAASEVIGQNPRLLNSGKTPKNRYQEMWQALTTGKPWQGELQNKKKNGEIFWESAHIAPVVDESGITRHYLAVKEDITLRKKQEEQLLHQAHFDTLTHLPNRFLALDRLTQLLKDAKRSKTLVAVLFLDLDDFKKVNDTLGHDIGDKLLIEAAKRLSLVVRSGDTVGRLGGDEFIVLLAGILDISDTRPVLKNLLEQFRVPFDIDDRELLLTISVGVAVFPGDGDSTSSLLRNADSAMYHAKKLGRNTAAYFTESMNREVSRRLVLEEQMYGALDRKEFSVNYQPMLELKSGRVIGAEALLRWYNPVLGNISPEEFIAVSEQSGLIVSLGQFVLSEALQHCAKMHQIYDSEFRMAVNLSPRQFRDPDLMSFIEKKLQQSGVSGRHLELEITEGVLMSGHDYVNDALASLSNMGISISMDDFGTGYSSLSYLRTYPFDVLKIDRSFVNDITVDPADQALIKASIAMAHGLNLKVVAEGVETKEQLAYLKEQNCDYAQGYFFAKPMPEDELLEWISMKK